MSSVDWWLRSRGAGTVPLPFFTADEIDAVRRFYGHAADAPPTPLRHFPGLAAELGLSELLIKDESARFGLPAFKIVGARYAIARLSEDRGATLRHLACATAGNHGRAVARSAHERGLEAHVYVPTGIAPARVNALRSEGAHVVVTSVDYDETVRLMAQDAAESGWTVVSDTAWDGHEQTPRWIMAGYSWILEEAAAEWGDQPPDLVVVQAGVGSLAGAVAGWLSTRYGARRPRLIVAEPDGSACVLESLRAGRPVKLDACAPTTMVGLRCAEVSPLAWRALEDVVDAAIAIPDRLASEAMQRLAKPQGGDPVIHAGPSGAAGIAALLALVREPAVAPMRKALGVGPATRVLAIVTEGVTDRDVI